MVTVIEGLVRHLVDDQMIIESEVRAFIIIAANSRVRSGRREKTGSDDLAILGLPGLPTSRTTIPLCFCGL